MVANLNISIDFPFSFRTFRFLKSIFGPITNKIVRNVSYTRTSFIFLCHVKVSNRLNDSRGLFEKKKTKIKMMTIQRKLYCTLLQPKHPINVL